MTSHLASSLDVASWSFVTHFGDIGKLCVPMVSCFVQLPSAMNMLEFATSNMISMLHSDPECLEIATLVMGHSLVRSLVRSHRSLVRLLRTARFARALRCAHSLPSSWDSGIFLSDFQSVLDHCGVCANGAICSILMS